MCFGKLDAAIARRTDLSPGAKVVHAVLRMFQNNETGQCNPQQRTLAEACGTSRMSISRHLNELRAAGLLGTARTQRGLCYTLPDVTKAGQEFDSVVTDPDITSTSEVTDPCITPLRCAIPLHQM